MAKTKYKKYKTLYLPQEIVEAVILFHKFRIDDYEKVQLDICFDLINNIILKSAFNRSKDEARNILAPMASTYLKKRYKNKYKLHLDFLVNNGLLYRDEYFEGSASNLYLLDLDIYLIKSESTIREFINVDDSNIYYTYCFNNNIVITLLDTIEASDSRVQKNGNYPSWYKIKILITTSNKSFFTGDYDSDTDYIRSNKKNFNGKLGQHFRNSFSLKTEDAIRHTLKQFQNETKESKTKAEEQKAYNRSLARISSIWSIDKGRLNKSLRFNRNGTNNRLDTNLTNLASDLKPFIVGWEDMVYLDLKNSQPVLFNTVLKEIYKKGSSALKSEIDMYRKATFAGKWYEELMPIFEADRDSCKEIWMCIAYSKNKSYQNYKKPFKKAYPEIYKIIESIKSSDYKNFAVSLQKLESEIFIDKICKELVDVDILPFTVHDALIVRKSDQDKTLQIMEDVFLEYLGDIPKISVE